PRAERAGGQPEAALADGALEAVLDEIIGCVGIARQGAGITPQRRHSRLDLVQKVAQLQSRAWARAALPPGASLSGRHHRSVPHPANAVAGGVAGGGVVDPQIERPALVGPDPGAVLAV